MKIRRMLLSTMLPLCTLMFVYEAQVLNRNIKFINYKNIETKDYRNDKDYSNIGLKLSLILVNKDNALDSEYEPINLVTPNIPFIKDSTEEEMQMQDIASEAIEKLFDVAEDEGINLLATSAYRSYNTQLEIYTRRVKSKGKEEADKYVAYPGKSEHQSGLSIDITNKRRRFTETCKEARWLANNAYRFGFILRYPEGKEDITGISYEPWHVRYVGKEVARNIFEQGITLEEYIKNKQ